MPFLISPNQLCHASYCLRSLLCFSLCRPYFSLLKPSPSFSHTHIDRLAVTSTLISLCPVKPLDGPVDALLTRDCREQSRSSGCSWHLLLIHPLCHPRRQNPSLRVWHFIPKTESGTWAIRHLGMLAQMCDFGWGGGGGGEQWQSPCLCAPWDSLTASRLISQQAQPFKSKRAS